MLQIRKESVMETRPLPAEAGRAEGVKISPKRFQRLVMLPFPGARTARDLFVDDLDIRTDLLIFCELNACNRAQYLKHVSG